jgi:hypothetical protein
MVCGPASKPFTPHLYPIFLAHLKDENEEVRSNCVFGLGVCVANGGEAMYGYPWGPAMPAPLTFSVSTHISLLTHTHTCII